MIDFVGKVIEFLVCLSVALWAGTFFTAELLLAIKIIMKYQEEK